MELFKIKITWLSVLNFFLFQWFCFRLGREIKNKKNIKWKLLFFILPLTGWWSDYVYIYKKK